MPNDSKIRMNKKHKIGSKANPQTIKLLQILNLIQLGASIFYSKIYPKKTI